MPRRLALIILLAAVLVGNAAGADEVILVAPDPKRLAMVKRRIKRSLNANEQSQVRFCVVSGLKQALSRPQRIDSVVSAGKLPPLKGKQKPAITTPEPAHDLMTIEDVCSWLQVKKSYVYALTSQGMIPCLKIGHHLRFKRADLERWLQTRAKESPLKTLSYP